MQSKREYGDRETTDAALCNALDDEDRETIAKLSEARGQTTAGVVWAGVEQVKTESEGRIIEFSHPAEARAYYASHKAKELEFDGAYDELTPEGYYANPAECVGNLLKQRAARHREKAHAAARYLDANDPDTRVVVTGEYNQIDGIPQLDAELEIQHGTDGEGDE